MKYQKITQPFISLYEHDNNVIVCDEITNFNCCLSNGIFYVMVLYFIS